MPICAKATICHDLWKNECKGKKSKSHDWWKKK